MYIESEMRLISTIIVLKKQTGIGSERGRAENGYCPCGTVLPAKEPSGSFGCVYKIKHERYVDVLMLEDDGGIVSEISKRAHQLRIDQSVVMTGTRADIPQLLSAMDVFFSLLCLMACQMQPLRYKQRGCIVFTLIPLLEKPILLDCSSICLLLPEPSLGQLKCCNTHVEYERKDMTVAFTKHHYDIASVCIFFVNAVLGNVS